MREKIRCLAFALALLMALAFVPAATAHPNPAECSGPFPTVGFGAETLEQLKNPVREGDEIPIVAEVNNRGATACELTNIRVVVHLPEFDGTSEELTVIHNASLAKGVSLKAFSSWVVDLEDSDFEGSLAISWTATIHDGPEDTPASGQGVPVKFTLTRPTAELTVTPDRTSGEPPLTVNYTYRLTNASPLPSGGIDAPHLLPTEEATLDGVVTDGNCEPVTFKLVDPVLDLGSGLGPGESWTFTCSRTFTLPGTYTNLPMINAVSSVDGRSWPQAAAGSNAVTVLGSDLTIDKSHEGELLAGGRGIYRLTVTNRGNQASRGTVTVADQLPAGLTATGISGSGWSCAIESLSCTRSDQLQSGASYPDVIVRVRVSPNPPESVVNTATVSGGSEPEAARSNNTASDPALVRAPAQPEPPAGKVFRVRKVNSAPGPSVTFRVTLPAAGQLVADDARKANLVKRSKKNVKRARTVSLTVKANRRLRRQLVRTGKPRKVKLRFSFAASGNPVSVAPISAVRTVTFAAGPASKAG